MSNDLSQSQTGIFSGAVDFWRGLCADAHNPISVVWSRVSAIRKQGVKVSCIVSAPALLGLEIEEHDNHGHGINQRRRNSNGGPLLLTSSALCRSANLGSERIMEPKTNEGENEAPKRCSACEKESSALKKCNGCKCVW